MDRDPSVRLPPTRMTLATRSTAVVVAMIVASRSARAARMVSQGQRCVRAQKEQICADLLLLSSHAPLALRHHARRARAPARNDHRDDDGRRARRQRHPRRRQPDAGVAVHLAGAVRRRGAGVERRLRAAALRLRRDGQGRGSIRHGREPVRFAGPARARGGDRRRPVRQHQRDVAVAVLLRGPLDGHAQSGQGVSARRRRRFVQPRVGSGDAHLRDDAREARGALRRRRLLEPRLGRRPLRQGRARRAF
mmetsp:Transcript_3677/g.11661  ORF Transcript_3677/g.11661 Transcript_3677/m.11661 type:complete len:250 (+) Transcript_3677:664-1413(+)